MWRPGRVNKPTTPAHRARVPLEGLEGGGLPRRPGTVLATLASCPSSSPPPPPSMFAALGRHVLAIPGLWFLVLVRVPHFLAWRRLRLRRPLPNVTDDGGGGHGGPSFPCPPARRLRSLFPESSRSTMRRGYASSGDAALGGRGADRWAACLEEISPTSTPPLPVASPASLWMRGRGTSPLPPRPPPVRLTSRLLPLPPDAHPPLPPVPTTCARWCRWLPGAWRALSRLPAAVGRDARRHDERRSPHRSHACASPVDDPS